MKVIIACITLCIINNFEVNAQYYNIGKFDTLHSTILNEDRSILVHIPENEVQSNVRYPVMYLLDGDAHFTKTVGIIAMNFVRR